MGSIYIKLLFLATSIFCTSFVQAEQADREKERQRLLKKINEAQKIACDDTSKPCKEFLPNSNQSKAAKEYQEEVFERIRRVAKDNYPESLAADGRYGFVIVSLELNRDGGLERSRLMKKSEVKEINAFALEVLKTAAPYPKFENSFNKKTDIVVITKSLHFNIQNRGQSVEKSN